MTELKTFQRKALQLSEQDDVAVALVDLKAGETIVLGGNTYVLSTDVLAKHKFALKRFAPGQEITMYDTVVGRSVTEIPFGAAITSLNTRHEVAQFGRTAKRSEWIRPDANTWKDLLFEGYRRSDGQVGTRNCWLVVPLVFCENNNILAMRRAFSEELGDTSTDIYRQYVAELAQAYRSGGAANIRGKTFSEIRNVPRSTRLFPNIDGVRFLTHEMGCGGTREDARALCGLIAGYICHPNVAGATIVACF